MPPSAYTTEDTSSAYSGIPPFPNDVPTAPLLRLNYSALQTSEAERNAFFTASKDLGFFYLDLRGDELGQQLLAEAEQLFHVGEELFKEGAEELNNYDYSKGEREEGGGGVNGEKGEVRWKEGREPSYMGYKSMGKGVVDKAGNRDKNEFYNVGPLFLSLLVSLVPSHPSQNQMLTQHRHPRMIYSIRARTPSHTQNRLWTTSP